MYQNRDVYDYIAAMDIEEKEELLEELKKMINEEKDSVSQSNLKKQWKEILRLINKLKLERYIDDQLEMDEIWRILQVSLGNYAVRL